MKPTMFVLGLVALGSSLGMGACAAPAGDAAEAAGAAVSTPQRLPVHVMPLFNEPAPDPTTEATPVRLTNYGGPVIPNVKIYAVYWTSRAQFQSQLNSFYTSIVDSTYMDWLKEYDTSTQQIRRGSFGGSFVITPSHTSTSLMDADIQAEIAAQMDAGVLPQTDGVNALYMLHFPAGIKISLPNGSSTATSCVQFCAYHGTFKKSDKYVFYGIHPDLGQSGCNAGCGGGSVQDNTTSVASHEMVEAITDAAVGLATDLAPPLAWYNDQQGEIGDICNGRQSRVNGFAVQTQWSNNANKCTATGM
jgi:hypothetical protein